MKPDSPRIASAQSMIEVIRETGIIPFSRNRVRGWSIEEMTNPDWWFTTSDNLGPWDWKIDAVHEGLLYGKFISRKSAFATEQMYRHLMNWRRSLPQYRVAEGGRGRVETIDDRLQKYLSPTLLSAIREHESLETSEIRSLLEKTIPLETRKKVGGHIEKYLIPKVTKQTVDFLLGFLDMGTWTVVGDITRVYRGADCEYKGWQRNTVTTPDALFKVLDNPSENPFWARFIEDDTEKENVIDCSPEESRLLIIDHLTSLFPEEKEKFEKVI
ncbi:MAG: hypothetical protein ACI3ZS_04345 [Candidatus Cryptobacteroides sp.]